MNRLTMHQMFGMGTYPTNHNYGVLTGTEADKPPSEEAHPMSERSKAVRYYSEDDVCMAILWEAQKVDHYAQAVADMTGRLLKDAKPLSLRPEVAAFAQAMEEKLRQNDHKTHWREYPVRNLMGWMVEETDELRREVYSERPDSERVKQEAAMSPTSRS